MPLMEVLPEMEPSSVTILMCNDNGKLLANAEVLMMKIPYARCC